MPAAWALVNVRVWDGVDDDLTRDAISFDDDGRVATVGAREAVVAGLGSPADVVDGEGATVVPAFVDAHTHIRAAASASVSADCRDIGSTNELLALVAAEAARATPGTWVTLTGLDPYTLGSPLPGRTELDRVSGDHPVRIRHRSLHAWLLNSAAAGRVAAEIGEAPLDGLVVDDRGVLRHAFGRVCEPFVQEQAVRDWSQRRLREGVVAVLDATVTNGAAEIAQLRAWSTRGVIRQGVRAMVGEGEAADPADAAIVAATKLMFAGETRAAGGARERIQGAWKTSHRVAIHCADIEALGDVIAAVEAVPGDGRRLLRIEHAALAPPEWLPRIAAFAEAVVTQPGFVHAHGDRYLATIDGPLHPWLYRLRSWLDAGVALAAGSDEPAGPADPLVAWRAMIDRQTSGGSTLGDQESLTRRQAFRALSATAADVSGFEGLGHLRPGARGSVVLLVGDPFETLNLDEVGVSGIVLDGRVVATAGPQRP